MDAMGHVLKPDDELTAGQAELVRGVWLAEMLSAFKDRASLFNIPIDGTWVP